VIVHLLVISDVKMVVTYESTVVWKDSTSFKLLSWYWPTETENINVRQDSQSAASNRDPLTGNGTSYHWYKYFNFEIL